ncbi:tetratricopeptide repeat protein [Streptomyces xiamenensis]|uniref:tetratricopeptide repeat protein n=1 Tax=Streptomyces xiamenensis TaxID=408015 RepID=UPI0035DBBDEA
MSGETAGVSPETVAAAKQVMRVRQLMDLGRTQEASSILSAIVSRHPNFGAGWSMLAACQLHQGDPQAALLASDKSLGVPQQGDFDYAWQVRLDILIALGRPEEALAAGVELIRIAPDGWRGHDGWARAELARPGVGTEKALAAAERAVALAPEEPDAHYTLGRAAYGLGRLDLAEQAFATVLHLDPQRADAHQSLGIVRSHHRTDPTVIDLGARAAGLADAMAVQPEESRAQAQLAGVIFVLVAKLRWIGWFCLLFALFLTGFEGGWPFQAGALAMTAVVCGLSAWRIRSQLPARSRGPLLTFARTSRPIRLVAAAAGAPLAAAVLMALMPLYPAGPTIYFLVALVATVVFSRLSRRAAKLS